ncbi:MAG: hypothetical protein LIO80_08285, partial [Lachnospiraceae bacterium]|nr:hypothetical protein [Lachnospiraceae bacterium]
KGKCVFCLCVFTGMFAASWMQFYSAYRNFFFTAGYMGGFQSRYYLCWVPVLAFAFAYLFQDAQENGAVKTDSAGKWIKWLALAVVLLMFYGSFLYTLLTYGS